MITTIIFDMDGVLLKSIPIHFQAWKRLLTPYFELSREDFNQYIGKSTADTFSALQKIHGFNLDADDFEKRKDKVYAELTKDIMLYPYVISVLENLQKTSLKRGVATSELREIAHSILKTTDVFKYFSVVVGLDGVLRPKPYPDLFLKAAELLGSPAEECLVIEDSPPGIAAAKKAGMFVVAVTNSFARDRLSEADIITDDLPTTLRELNLYS